MFALWLTLAAHAATPGHANPADIASQSKLYAKASASAGGTYQERETRAQALATALAAYGEALDLLGERASQAERDRLQALQRRFNRELAVVQAFADTALDDFNTEFSAAMERALPAGTAICQARIPAGPALPGMPVRTKDNPDCTGEDRNAAVAARMDADPKLQAAVQEILGIAWPEITLEPEPQAPIGAGPWLAVQPAMRQLFGARLTRIDRADTEARVPLAAALEEGIEPSRAGELVAQGRAITARTASARAQAAEPVLRAIDARTQKALGKATPSVAWCANPDLLGGCRGDRATEAQRTALLADKKVAQAAR